MTLATFIKEYRMKHDLSQRQFASMCGVSNGYISVIENEKSYITGRKMKVSIGKLMLLAKGMRISLHELVNAVDDMDVVVNEETKTAPTPMTEAEAALLELFKRVPADKQNLVLGMIRAAIESQG